jgi:hypothetical protein
VPPPSLNGALVGDKAAELENLNRSVLDASPLIPAVGASSTVMLFALAQAGDSFVPWGRLPFARDAQLRNFWPTEPFLASAMGIIGARNGAMDWKLTGDEQTADAAALMLQNANFGAGWEDFIIRITLDLLSQDKGAFAELLRTGDSPEAPVVGLNSLDAARCHLTGIPEEPVWYEDALNRFHRMKWYQVVQLLEMPSPYTFPQLGHFYRLQYSAVTRLLRAAQIIKSIGVYNDEKISGRFQRAVHLLQGVTAEEVKTALERTDFLADQAGLSRYMQPAIVGSIDPKATIDVKTLELASLPEGWDEEKSLKWYLTAMSMALLTDYQEFAPLPGGGLGTSAQSEVLHMKSRGKGQGLFMQLIARLMNLHGVLPRNVQFEWDEQDIEAEKIESDVKKTRGEMRALRIASGEISAAVARQLALEDGDLSEEQVAALEAEDKAAAEAMAVAPPSPAPDDTTVEGEDRADGGPGAGDDATVEGEDRMGGTRSMTTVTPEWGRKAQGSVPFGTLIISRLHRAYAMVSDDASGLGYFPDLDDRLAVADSIGPALKVFEDALREHGVWDIAVRAEDADRMVEAGLKATDPEGEGLDDEEARRAFEGEVGADVYRGLQAVRRELRAYLRAQPRGERAARTPEPPAEIEPTAGLGLVKVQDVEHGPGGRITRIVTRYEEAAE